MIFNVTPFNTGSFTNWFSTRTVILWSMNESLGFNKMKTYTWWCFIHDWNTLSSVIETNLLIMAIISARSWSTHYFKLGSGSKSRDLFGDLEITSFSSFGEVGQKILSSFQLNITSTSKAISQVLFGESEIILFLRIIVWSMKKLPNLSDRILAE